MALLMSDLHYACGLCFRTAARSQKVYPAALLFGLLGHCATRLDISFTAAALIFCTFPVRGTVVHRATLICFADPPSVPPILVFVALFLWRMISAPRLFPIRPGVFVFHLQLFIWLFFVHWELSGV